MNEEDNYLFGNIGSIYHEVRQSFYYLISVYSFLAGKVPDTVNVLLGEIEQVCKELHQDIETLPNIFDYSSASTAANQIRSDAIKWKKETARLANLIDEIEQLDIQLEDASLNKFLNELLSHSLQQFSLIVDSLATIKPQDLKRKTLK